MSEFDRSRPMLDIPSLNLRRLAQHPQESNEEYENYPLMWFPYSDKFRREEVAPGVQRAPITYGEWKQ